MELPYVCGFRLLICCKLLCLGVQITYSPTNEALQSSVPQLMPSCGVRLRKLVSTFQSTIIVLMDKMPLCISQVVLKAFLTATTNSKHIDDYGMFVVTI